MPDRRGARSRPPFRPRGARAWGLRCPTDPGRGGRGGMGGRGAAVHSDRVGSHRSSSSAYLPVVTLSKFAAFMSHS